MANWRKTQTPGRLRRALEVVPGLRRRRSARCRCKPSWRGRRRDPVTGKPIWQKTTKDRGEVLAWLGRRRARRRARGRAAARGPTFEHARRRVARRRRARPHRPAPRQAASRTPTTTIASMRRSLGARPAARVRRPIRRARSPRSTGSAGSTSSAARASRARRSRNHVSRRVGHLRLGARRRAAASSRATRCASSSCRPTTRSRACASRSRPRPRRCSPRSSPRTASPTRSPSTPACAARRSTASNGPTSSTATTSPRASRRDAPRARPARTAARRSPTTSARSSRDAWERQGRPREGKVVERSVMSGKLADARRRGLGARRPQPHHAPRVPPHLRLAADGRRLHDQGAHGVHGPRRPADGQPLREAPAAAAARTTPPTDSTTTCGARGTS